MTSDELISALSESFISGSQVFLIISGVNSHWVMHPEDPKSLDLIVRLVERRDQLESVLNGAARMIDDIARFAGLYPYLNKSDDPPHQFVARCMMLPNIPNTIFHKGQVQALGHLLKGRSLVLSAPTSFGKSLLVDAIIRVKSYRTVVIVVPTLSLLDEYRKRLGRNFPKYDIITRPNDTPFRDYRIFLGTQERIEARDTIPNVDLFVIDEFYKLDLKRNDERSASLNNVMAQYAREARQIYLLGPSIESINNDETSGISLPFMRTNFSPVATDIVRRQVSPGERSSALVQLLNELKHEQTLVYFRSPRSMYQFIVEQIEKAPSNRSVHKRQLSEWIRENYHPEWILARCLAQGIGLHHGRIPRALGQYEIDLFNKEEIRFLFCTSSLIEGVNTKARNVIIYDNHISTDKLDRFTFDNIKGRAGRMFKHFVGRVFLFNEAPLGSGVNIEIPMLNGFENATDSVLLSVPQDVLSPAAARRKARILDRSQLSERVLAKWARFGVDGLETIAEELFDRQDDETIIWSGQGTYEQIRAVFELAWSHLKFGKHEIASGKSAAFFTNRLRSSGNISTFMRNIVRPDSQLRMQYEIDRCLNFLRAAEFTLPQVLLAVNDVAQDIGIKSADYSVLAGRLPIWFAKKNYSELEEYGVPFSVAQKYDIHIEETQNFDDLSIDISRISDPVERRILGASLDG